MGVGSLCNHRAHKHFHFHDPSRLSLTPAGSIRFLITSKCQAGNEKAYCLLLAVSCASLCVVTIYVWWEGDEKEELPACNPELCCHCRHITGPGV